MAKIFVSEIENLLPAPAKEISFFPTPGFGRYKKWFYPDAVKHPAKANTTLLEWLITKYTKKGEIILDPMAGTGSTGIISSLLGRNAICVELEEKFVKWMKQSVAILESHPSVIFKRGRVVVIQGDAKNLRQILSINNNIDTILTSPPYKTANKGGGLNKNPPDTFRGVLKNHSFRLSDNLDNLDNMPYGKIDAVISSPPYAKSVNANNNTKQRAERLNKLGYNPEKYMGGKARCCSMDWQYNSGKNNIDIIITSPPYENTLSRRRHVSPRVKAIQTVKGLNNTYHPDSAKKQIGSLNGGTYLSVMFTVYSEIYEALKPGGLAIIIVKPFIKNRKVVDLPYHTLLLMQKVGFILEEALKFYLIQQSFWRINYYLKPENANVPRIRHEYVIIGSK